LKKQKTNTKAILHPIFIAKLKNSVAFFCVSYFENKAQLFLCENLGKKFQRKEQIEIFSQKGKKDDLKNCYNFHFFHIEDIWYVTYAQHYSRFFKKRIRTIIAQSSDALSFQIIDSLAGKFPEEFAIVSRHRHRRNFLAYFGRKSIYATASKDLENWHISGELLAPRKDHFDSGSLHLVDAITTEKGILVLYGLKKNSQKKHQLMLGGALFAIDQPYKILWRSSEPLLEKNILAKDFPLTYLGSIIENGIINVYWVNKKNEIVLEKIKPESSGIGCLKKRPSHLKRHHANPILKPNQENTWEYDATFNPAAIHLEDKIHLIYRAIGANGMSVLGYASSCDGLTIEERLESPVFVASGFDQNKKREDGLLSPQYVSGGSWIGCEDPRLTHVGDRIYMTYVSFDGCNPPGVALTYIKVEDFLKKKWNWKKPVLISKTGEIQKNWMLFPEKINGKYAVLHSITPHISIEYIDDLEKDGLVIHSEKKPGKDENRWDNIVRGAGAPPLKTDFGWLVLYHAMDRKDPNRYKVGAMILDSNDPTKILYRCSHPILEPAESYENEGAKSGVVYVCGAVIKDETLFVYYGGADSVVCVATANVNEFLSDIIRENITGV
jgi:predicted GH43/DUF377 family glycosyl hydrolase